MQPLSEIICPICEKVVGRSVLIFTKGVININWLYYIKDKVPTILVETLFKVLNKVYGTLHEQRVINIILCGVFFNL